MKFNNTDKLKTIQKKLTFSIYTRHKKYYLNTSTCLLSILRYSNRIYLMNLLFQIECFNKRSAEKLILTRKS